MNEQHSDSRPKSLLAWPARNKLAAFMLLLAFASGTLSFAWRNGGLFTGSSRYGIEGYDDNYYYFWLRAVLVDHSVDFTPEITTYNSWNPGFRDMVIRETKWTPLGLPANKYPIGWALSGVPWFLAADLTSGLLNLSGKHVPLDGWGPVYQATVILGQAVYACLSLWFSCRIIMRLFPARVAVPGVLLAWLASPLFIYQTENLSMSHSVIFFAVTGAWYFTLRTSERPDLRRYWMLTGCFCALTVLVRNQGALLLLYPVALWIRLIAGERRLLRHALPGGICFLLVLSPQLVAWKMLYGSFFVYSYSGEGFHWLHPHLWKVLFSSYHGWFNWNPAMAVGCAGFVLWVWRERSLMAWCFLVSSAAYWLTNAAWDCWWFGAAFGAREFDASTFFVMIGIACLLKLSEPRRVLFPALVGVSLLLVVWNLNLTWISESAGMIPWEAPLTNSQKMQISIQYWSGRHS